MSTNEKRQPKPFGNLQEDYWKSLEYIARTQEASREILQREIPLLYQKALWLLDAFAEKGFIAKGNPEEKREVFITYETYLALKKEEQ